MGDIVVGVDGSEASLAALGWAIEEGRLRNLTVVALCAWELPQPMAPTTLMFVDSDQLAESAQAMLEHAVASVPADGVAVVSRVEEGPAARRLAEASADAELVVVGSRGRGGFSGMLLGSVSQHLVAHAHCPVLVHHLRRGD